MNTNLQLLKTYLKDEDYLVATVSSAKTALLKLKSHQFDLILLDIVMPEMNGIELCKILKENEITKNTPIIFLTAVSSDEIIIDAFDAGGIDYIKKPFNPGELKRKIKNHLNLINYRKEIEKAKEEADLANQAKSIFLGNISHELRTPLNGIVATLELLSDTNLDKSQEEMVNIASISAANLTHILNDLLDLTKIESGILEINNQLFCLKEMIDSTLKIFNQKAIAKNLNFNLSFDENIPDQIVGDEYRTQQVLMHILDNALKFSDEGTIEVNIKLIKQNSSELEIQYCVEDHGKGIDLAQQKTIFNSFTQIENNNTRSTGGMGSGLSLAKKIVKLLGGEIKVVSELGQGSTFCFTVQYYLPSHKNDTTENPESLLIKEKFNLSNLVVLVVDDNIVNLKVAHMMLKKMGVNVHLAENGKEALAKYDIHQPNLIFMDIQMPVMDGLETTQKIRTLEKDNNSKPVAIIALTASAMKGDKEIFLKSGMNDYISKPFKKNDLDRIIKKYCWVNT